MGTRSSPCGTGLLRSSSLATNTTSIPSLSTCGVLVRSLLRWSTRKPSFPQFKAKAWQSICPGLEDSGLDLLKGMLTYDPSRRTQGKDLLNHPFFNGREKALWQYCQYQQMPHTECPLARTRTSKRL